ncbi:MAG TPA: MFS transporter [Sandaracinaceae bacterium]
MAATERVDPTRMAHPRVFWLGLSIITVGVALTTYEFRALTAAEGTPYVLTPRMILGLVVDLVGTVMAAWAVLPHGWLEHYRRRRAGVPSEPALETEREASPSGAEALDAMDHAKLNKGHWVMMLRMYAGLVIDTMKPATLGFMLPGMQAEYGLSPTTVSLFPLAAVIGLTIGSVLFGMLGDLVGRRASFIFTALVFATTAPCGLMPDYPWHLVTCFLMGLAAGGELPLIYTMLAESTPAKHRGWAGVVLGGIGGLSGYLVAGLLARWIEPTFSWRALWLPNLPTALFMLWLLRYVHESPRFLLHMGFVEEARRAMAEVGVVASATAKAAADASVTVKDLLVGPLRGITATLCLYGFAWGLCNWGFITWLPGMLREAGFDASMSSQLLTLSAACALPATVIAALAYGFWSSRWTATLSAVATAAALLGFWICAPYMEGRTWLIVALTATLFVASSSMIGVLAPYSVELYPTALRGLGSGVVAGSSKSGGIVGPLLVGALLGAGAGAGLPALVIAIPVAIASVAIGVRGTETRGRSLEELAARAAAIEKAA